MNEQKASRARLSHLRMYMEESRKAFREIPRWYIFNRGLAHTLGEDQSYVSELPTFQGKDIIQIVDQKITEHKRTAQATDQPFEEVVWVDGGYGRGQALIDGDILWNTGDNKRENKIVQPVGYGSSNHSKLAYSVSPELILPPTTLELMRRGIHLFEGNILDMRHVLNDNYADVFSSLEVLKYVKLPYWILLQRIYRILKPGGIALITGAWIANYRELNEYLHTQGYSFEFGVSTIAFQKTSDVLYVPAVKTDYNTFYPDSYIQKITIDS